ncbi:xanthine dehydrogenase family protein molybdopterin-binding subunit [Christiangramia forsetii]|uniref:Molybdenum-dependent oxidoreductase molybdenum-binding subunit n=2 Tax=Christiangramia forsetii TaxID=411153 RepID=A0LYI1_CHRFK|nr:xanthine dehydrogenase family protein molybdopterin-binding subunit [Christiangramia forsetii]GGG34161.1 oxidoreductase [Christiangramia forsetii]CAL65426.1 molybdenum-dependent oxidoreductase molybdenum-binding subunit [Christiangramia forsetii KT0803]
MKTLNETGVGKAIDRVEGHLKVTGMAKYASEFPVENKVYGQGINSTIAKGEILSIDTSEAENLPGVLKVITYKNAEKLKTFEEEMPPLWPDVIAPVLQTNKVHYYGEYVGFVVAETFEIAQHAARLVKFEYKKDHDAAINFEENKSKAYKPTESSDYSRGNIEQGMSEADVKVEETYTTAMEHHHPMELHAVIASWDNGKLTAYSSQQMIDANVTALANTFQIPKENVRIIAAFVGGGFGSKLNIERHVVMASMASQMVRKPVQATVTRQQMFTNTGFRQFNEQKMRIGAKKDGKLTALSHDTISHTSTTQQYQESCGFVSKMLYNVANNSIKHRLIPMNLQTPFAMRAPGEATGSFALECAMDEMAYKLNMDPIEFRVKNDTQTDLSENKPFSSRLFVECLRIGAEKFGWENRKKEPRTNTNGNWLIGHGVSAASRKAPYQKTSAKVIIELAGGEPTATIKMDATDIGTGSYTIIAQTVSEYLGIRVEQVNVEIGDSEFPKTPGSGGSWGAASYCNGARAACENVISELKNKLNLAETEEVSIGDLLKRNDLTKYEATGTAEPSEEFKKHSVFSFGANFTEVWVDKDTGMWKIKRMVNVGSAGKILNPKTAYGQIIGGLTMGAGMVIAEQSKIEPNFGNFITRTLADYHVPVNLDMANIDVIFLPEDDKIANKMGVKGIGELGITSVAASIANAIFNATGKRMRSLPITPEKLIEAPIEKQIET